ncbi:PIG-L deacetylase family protein [Enterovirga aerilata]|uniref:PIG-L family deacetylase n=1 Tax=Enterovirga aerilata TaxID=2730920 RepID=A0A849ID56_9HYPH|nr:PIG-L family deacetylase [Enterovirga sp. DB1703]NNM71843.1 PIG-L family deacetylase [Enterovirga sp. DB1703]
MSSLCETNHRDVDGRAKPGQDAARVLAAIADPARPRIPGRTVLVFAHPDDETLACGALLPRLEDVRIVHVTDGAPRNGEDARRHGYSTPTEYAAARREELRAAAALAGVPEERLICFDVADQGAAFALADIARRLAPVVQDADLVIAHAYEGGHPDHDAVCWAVHAALGLSDAAGCGAGTPSARGRGQGDGAVTSPKGSLPLTRSAARAGSLPGGESVGARRPVLLEVPLYRLGPDGGWLRGSFGDEDGAAVLHLTPAERALKARMIAAHASQAGTLAGFGVADECYRAAPAYDFGSLPNRGALLYERYGWGLAGGQWLELAAAAARELRLERAA